MSTLNEPVDCEESPYLCVDGTSWYIARVYADLLDRWPGPTEIAAARAAYPQGLPDLQFAQEIVASPEYRHQVVQRLTQRLLGRPATPAEQDYWAPQDHRAITLGLMESHEYEARKGGGSAVLVEGVYQDLLDREADSDEVRTALARITTAGGRTVIQEIYDSAEHHAAQVDLIYLELLKMTPDRASRKTWVRELNAGMTWEQFIVAVVTTGEYQQRQEFEMAKYPSDSRSVREQEPNREPKAPAIPAGALIPVVQVCSPPYLGQDGYPQCRLERCRLRGGRLGDCVAQPHTDFIMLPDGTIIACLRITCECL
jgi:hypothetical protein